MFVVKHIYKTDKFPIFGLFFLLKIMLMTSDHHSFIIFQLFFMIVW